MDEQQRLQSVSCSLEASFRLKLGRRFVGFDVMVMLGCVFARSPQVSFSFLSL